LKSSLIYKELLLWDGILFVVYQFFDDTVDHCARRPVPQAQPFLDRARLGRGPCPDSHFTSSHRPSPASGGSQGRGLCCFFALARDSIGFGGCLDLRSPSFSRAFSRAAAPPA
jgi:hypothetical protein